ncbi:MAG: hypothetical protein SFU56_12980 [Capsulimonadales bacterium]|nr:hypothetical protein [Capsulimonadales bacterium]
MSLVAVSGIVEEGIIRLSPDVKVPDHTPVVVMIEKQEEQVNPQTRLRVHRPRPLYAEDAIFWNQIPRTTDPD